MTTCKRTHRPGVLAALGIAAVVATAALAGTPAWDDRPPIELTGTPEAGVSAASYLVDWSVASGADTAITLEGDGGLAFEAFTLQDPPRLVLDLPGVSSDLWSNRLEVDDARVARVRAGQYRTSPEPVARVVVDLYDAAAYRVERQGHRLVVHVGQPAEAPVEVAAAPAPAEPEPEIPSEPLEAEPMAVPEPAVEMTAAPVIEAPAPVDVAEASEPRVDAPEPPSPYEDQDFDALIEQARGGGDADFRPAYAAQADTRAIPLPTTETRTIEDEQKIYTGQKVSFSLVDADIKQVFRLFHDISGLNFVLDPSVAGTVTLVLDDVPWDQALDIILINNGLDKVYVNNVVRIATTTKLAQEAAARKALRDAKELEVAPVTITRTLSYAKAQDVERVVRDGILTPRGKVIVDERSNTLIIRDIPARIDAIDRLISNLDEETPQVMIEARIVEVSRDYTQDLGIQWGFTARADPAIGTQTGLQFPHSARVDYALNLPKNPAANSLGFSFGNVLDSFTLDLTLDALETEGYARRLSQPKIATQNNKEAEIEQGTRIPVVNTTATEINVEFVSASLRLRVTPQITAEGTIIMEVEVENNSPDFSNTVGDVPAINTQRAQTTVLVTDGGTTVIGGIFFVNEGTSEAGVPWFRNIPGLGWLFKTRSINNVNRELLIFLTPKILHSA